MLKLGLMCAEPFKRRSATIVLGPTSQYFRHQQSLSARHGFMNKYFYKKMLSYLLRLLNRKSWIIEGICSFKKESFMIQLDFFKMRPAFTPLSEYLFAKFLTQFYIKQTWVNPSHHASSAIFRGKTKSKPLFPH